MEIRLKTRILTILHKNGGWMMVSEIMKKLPKQNQFKKSTVKTAICDLCSADYIERKKIIGGDSKTNERVAYLILEKGLFEIGAYQRKPSILQLPTPEQIEKNLED